MCSMNLKPKAKKINPIRASTAFVDISKRGDRKEENSSLLILYKSRNIFRTGHNVR